MTALICRVADHCFWFGRHLERADATARTLSVTHRLALGSEDDLRDIWLPVIIVAGEEERFAELIGMEHAADGDLVQDYMTWNDGNPGSILSSIEALRENARAVRDQVSLETWQVINELRWWLLDDATRKTFASSRYAFYRKVAQGLHQIRALITNTMLEDTPQHFIGLGATLERGSQTARIVDVHHHANTLLKGDQVVDIAVWMSFLRALGAYEAFMKRERGKVSEAAVVRFLILETGFPRSVIHAVEQAHRHLMAIRPPERGESVPGERSVARLTELRDWLRAHDVASVHEQGVHDVLTHVVDESHGICDEIGVEFLGAT